LLVVHAFSQRSSNAEAGARDAMAFQSFNCPARTAIAGENRPELSSPSTAQRQRAAAGPEARKLPPS
jgi:hypothetical protein